MQEEWWKVMKYNFNSFTAATWLKQNEKTLLVPQFTE